jgi:transcriptional regulator with XRE-family HTH domain
LAGQCRGGSLSFPQIDQSLIVHVGKQNMEAQMNINGEVVRALREQKSWSQEHLASASGLSVRTVQRVEAESVASAETRLALAAALRVPVAELIPVPPSTNASVGSKAPASGERLKTSVYDSFMRKTILILGVGVVFVALAIALVILASGLQSYF